MKLFIYRGYVDGPDKSIHSYSGDDWETNKAGSYLCGVMYHYRMDVFVENNFSRPFCEKCKCILQSKGISMVQLAINQKLGVK